MKTLLRTSLLAWLLSICGFASVAEVYKSIDKYGNVSYSDTPSDESEAVDLGNINIQPAITPRPSPVKAAPPPPAVNPAPPSKPQALATKPKPLNSDQTGPIPLQKTETRNKQATPHSKYGLRIALPKPGSLISDTSMPITLVLLTTQFLSKNERFQATINGQPTGEASRANNLTIHLPENPGATVSLGASIVNDQGQVIEQALAVQISTQ